MFDLRKSATEHTDMYKNNNIQNKNIDDNVSTSKNLISFIKTLINRGIHKLKLLFGFFKKLNPFTLLKNSNKTTLIVATKKPDGVVQSEPYENNENIRYSGKIVNGQYDGKGELFFRNYGIRLNTFFQDGKLLSIDGQLNSSNNATFSAKLNSETNKLEGKLITSDFTYCGTFNSKISDKIWQPEGENGRLIYMNGNEAKGTFHDGCLLLKNEETGKTERIPVLRTDDNGIIKKRLFPLAICYAQRSVEALKNAQKSDYDSNKEPLDHMGNLVIMGDSLSDVGMMNKQFCGYFLSGKGYYNGRFCNGYVWSDFIGSRGYLQKYMSKESAKDFKVINLSKGGIVLGELKAWVQKLGICGNLKKQVSKYLAGERKPKDIVFTMLGSNDYKLFGQPLKEVPEIIRQYEEQLRRLIANGVKNIVVSNVADLVQVPSYQNVSQQERDEVTATVNLHNARLQDLLTRLQQEFPEVKTALFDAKSNLNMITEMAKEQGYTVNKPSIPEDRYRDWFCDKPVPYDSTAQHVYHDSAHITQEVQQMLASSITDMIVSEWGTRDVTPENLEK